MTDASGDATPLRVVVIGGGISGLAAAWALRHPSRARQRAARLVEPVVTVLEASPELGGKLQTSTFADLPIDTGPDAFLARVPWGVRLCQELGLDEDLVSPTGQAAYLLSHGKLLRFPSTTVLGIPSGLRTLADYGGISKQGVARAAGDYIFPGEVGRDVDDMSIGYLVEKRLGREVVDRLVEPLIGGINAGPVDQLSVSAAAPQLAQLSEHGASLMRAAHAQLKHRNDDQATTPMFYAPNGGMNRLARTLADRLAELDVELRTSTPVEVLQRSPNGGWLIELSEGGHIEADAVIITTPPQAAARLLKEVCPEATEQLATIVSASVTIVRMAYTTASLGHPLEGSGYLAVPKDGGIVTACSWTSSKWEHLKAPGQVVLRASLGRLADNRANEMTEGEIIASTHEELRKSLGARRLPFASDVTRWPESFPQYEPGHEAKVLRIEQALSELGPISIAGAALHGLGIPACIKTASDAAEQVLLRLAEGSSPSRPPAD